MARGASKKAPVKTNAPTTAVGGLKPAQLRRLEKLSGQATKLAAELQQLQQEIAGGGQKAMTAAG